MQGWVLLNRLKVQTIQVWLQWILCNCYHRRQHAQQNGQEHAEVQETAVVFRDARHETKTHSSPSRASSGGGQGGARRGLAWGCARSAR